MSHHLSTRYLTEIQTLTLLPDCKIGSWSSQCRKELQAGLRVTGSHPKCAGIYWLRKKEDPQRIVIISKWTEAVYFATSRSYLHHILLYLESPPTRSIHVNHAEHSFSSYSITNYFTAYFPIRHCSKNLISANVDSFIKATEHTYTNPESLRFVASGWIKETKMVNGEVAKGFMLCLMWTDRKSEERYKRENEHWRVLMRYFKRMGMLGEDQFHGKAFQVYGEGERERFEFSDDSSDDDCEREEVIGLIRANLEKLAPSCDKDSQTRESTSCGRSGDSLPGKGGSDVTRLSDLDDNFNSPKNPQSASREESCITSWWDEGPNTILEDDSDSESFPSTPLFTPSSSTMSLNSVFGNTDLLKELPGTWKSEYDISRPQPAVIENAIVPETCSKLIMDATSSGPWFPVCQLQRDNSSCSGDEDDEGLKHAAHPELAVQHGTPANTLNAASNEPPELSASVTRQLKEIFLANPGRHSSSAIDNAKSSLVCQLGPPKWNADEELRNAKSRFWQRRKPFVAPRLATQTATLQGRSPPDERTVLNEHVVPPEHDLTIDPLRDVGTEDKSRDPWWSYLRECLPSPSVSRGGTDVETGDVGWGS